VVEPFRGARGTLLGLTSCGIDTTPWKYLIAKLKEALDQVQLLSGLLPICASCKRIKDEHEVWQPLEVYIQAHSEAKFTHGVCPDCLRKLYPEYFPRDGIRSAFNREAQARSGRSFCLPARRRINLRRTVSARFPEPLVQLTSPALSDTLQ